MSVPDYRVRLFLSVDLTGSTAFKHQVGNALNWIKAFQRFYSEFPSMLANNYKIICQKNRGLHDTEKTSCHPKLWKTIGDEILFCCSVKSLPHLGVCIDAFVETLKIYGDLAKADQLDTKGNAWVASFPTPNCSIKPVNPFDPDNASKILDRKFSLPTEEDEKEVDLDPSKFDFLGKGIDAGFRISKNSNTDILTISPGLGILLCQCAKMEKITKFKTKVRFSEMQTFKGVAGTLPYPVITVDTCRNEIYQKLIEQERILLGKPSKQNTDDLEKYLTEYLNYHKIEVPVVRNTFQDDDFNAPKFYYDYCQKWKDEEELMRRDEAVREKSVENDEDETLSNEEIPLPYEINTS